MCDNEIDATRNDITLWLFCGGTTHVNAFSWEARLFLCCKALLSLSSCMKRAGQTKIITGDDQSCCSVLSCTGARGHFAHIDSFFFQGMAFSSRSRTCLNNRFSPFHQPWVNHSAVALCFLWLGALLSQIPFSSEPSTARAQSDEYVLFHSVFIFRFE